MVVVLSLGRLVTYIFMIVHLCSDIVNILLCTLGSLMLYSVPVGCIDICSYLTTIGGTNKDRVLLTDVSSITLEAGKMTNGRRTSPILQLECVGGTAGCYVPQPKVVQCINHGFDGYDVQWECKANMDYSYDF